MPFLPTPVTSILKGEGVQGFTVEHIRAVWTSLRNFGDAGKSDLSTKDVTDPDGGTRYRSPSNCRILYKDGQLYRFGRLITGRGGVSISRLKDDSASASKMAAVPLPAAKRVRQKAVTRDSSVAKSCWTAPGE